MQDTLLRAFLLASAGQHGEAERLLCGDRMMAESAQRLDLLARIRMEQGDETTARRLWEKLLALEPDHAGSVAALELLNRPWWMAPRFRKSAMRAVAAVGAVALAGIAWAMGARSREQPEVRCGAPDPAEVRPSIAEAATRAGERIVTIESSPTLQRLRAAQQELGLGEGDWLSVSVGCGEDVGPDSLDNAFRRSIAFVEAFSEIAGFPGERVLISARTNAVPPYAVLRVLRDKPEDRL